jgi:hypothetical protein
MAQKVDLSQQNIYGLPVVYTRTNGQPMEETLVWYSLSDAEAYAKTAKAYVGQVLTVVTNAGTDEEPALSSKVYVIDNESGDLKEVGTDANELNEALVGKVDYLGAVTALADLSTTCGKGDFYRVATAFTFGSETAHVGDIILATKDNPGNTDWDLIHTEIDSNTWVANTKTAAGYVAAGQNCPNKVWGTDAAGNPGWCADLDTTYDLSAPASQTNGNVTLNLTAGGSGSGSGTDSVRIKGSGATTVTTDASGIITISSTDTLTQNDNQTIKGNGTAFGVNDAVNIVGDGATTVTASAADKIITISSSDTKVTSVDNHYIPTTNSNTALSAEASGATEVATWDSTNLVTGVNIQRDAKGHVTGVTVDSIKMPSNPSHAVISGKNANGSADIKGSASSGDITLGDSGVTAGEYGPTANQTPSYGGTFNVPDIKVNAKGIVTSIENRSITIPEIPTGTTIQIITWEESD